MANIIQTWTENQKQTWSDHDAFKDSCFGQFNCNLQQFLAVKRQHSLNWNYGLNCNSVQPRQPYTAGVIHTFLTVCGTLVGSAASQPVLWNWTELKPLEKEDVDANNATGSVPSVLREPPDRVNVDLHPDNGKHGWNSHGTTSRSCCLSWQRISQSASANLHPRKHVCTSWDTTSVVLWLDYLMSRQTSDNLIVWFPFLRSRWSSYGLLTSVVFISVR